MEPLELKMRILRLERKKMLAIILGVIAGGVVGFLYYRFIGCASGTCKIASNPYISTVYWALLGGLIASTFK
jgi:hypothetical protein